MKHALRPVALVAGTAGVIAFAAAQRPSRSARHDRTNDLTIPPAPRMIDGPVQPLAAALPFASTDRERDIAFAQQRAIYLLYCPSALAHGALTLRAIPDTPALLNDPDRRRAHFSCVANAVTALADREAATDVWRKSALHVGAAAQFDTLGERHSRIDAASTGFASTDDFVAAYARNTAGSIMASNGERFHQQVEQVISEHPDWSRDRARKHAAQKFHSHAANHLLMVDEAAMVMTA